MAKIRGIKPDFWTDSKIVSLPIEARLLFIGLWNFADDFGVFEWDPMGLKMKIFPGDNLDVEKLLEKIVAAQCVHMVHTSGAHECFTKKTYGFIPNFLKHQRPDERYATSLLFDTKRRMSKSEFISLNKQITGMLLSIESPAHRAPHVCTSGARVEGEGEGEYNNKQIEEDIKEEEGKEKKSKKEKKRSYGEHGNCQLTEEEFLSLGERLGEKLRADYIDRLDLYVGSQGKKYKSHYLTILAWSRKDGVIGEPGNTAEDVDINSIKL